MCRCAANTTSRVVNMCHMRRRIHAWSTSRVVSVWRLGSDVKRMFMNMMLTVIWTQEHVSKET